MRNNLTALTSGHVKHFLILLALVLSSCATTVRIPAVDAYILFDDVPTYYNLTPSSPATGLVFHRNDKVRIIKRKDPSWLIFSWQGKDVYISKSNIGTSPSNSATSPTTYTPQSSYSPSSGSRTIQTGPRGGKYYINSNGNKTYVKHK